MGPESLRSVQLKGTPLRNHANRRPRHVGGNRDNRVGISVGDRRRVSLIHGIRTRDHISLRAHGTGCGQCRDIPMLSLSNSRGKRSNPAMPDHIDNESAVGDRRDGCGNTGHAKIGTGIRIFRQTGRGAGHDDRADVELTHRAGGVDGDGRGRHQTRDQDGAKQQAKRQRFFALKIHNPISMRHPIATYRRQTTIL